MSDLWRALGYLGHYWRVTLGAFASLLGVFAAGHITNEKLACSQLLGGMTMGLSMALHDESVLDPRFGDYVNPDFAE